MFHRAAVILVTLLASYSLLADDTSHFSLHGFVAARAVDAAGGTTWLKHGWSPFDDGRDSGRQWRGDGRAALVVEWKPSERYRAVVHAVGSAVDSDYDASGVAEAFGEAKLPVGRIDELRLKAGVFFLPTSRENVRPGWSTPYTITFSSWNSWIANELRPTGATAEYRHADGDGGELRLGGGAFIRNDTAGTLISWRGWTIGDRITPLGETVALPPLSSFDTSFPGQRRSGTRPFEKDLDSRPGWTAWGRVDRPAWSIQFLHFNNDTDRALHGGDYAWDLRFDTISGEWAATSSLTFAGELAAGRTGMGFENRPYVDNTFRSAYLLASWSRGGWRITPRLDSFLVSDLDRSSAEDNRQHGTALTLALIREFAHGTRIGAEWTQTRQHRAVLERCTETACSASQLMIEVRQSF